MALPPRPGYSITTPTLKVRAPNLSSTFGALVATGREFAQFGSELRQQQAADAGAKAVTRDPDTGQLTVDLKNEFFASGQAYNQAAKASYLSNIQPDITAKMMELGQKFRDDPDGFQTAASGAVDGFVSGALDAGLGGEVEQLANRELDRVFGHVISSKQKRDLVDASTSLESQLSEKSSQYEALARQSGLDTPDAQSLASEMSDITEIQVQQGFLTPAQGDEQIRQLTLRAQNQAVLGTVGRVFETDGQAAALRTAEDYAKTPDNGLSTEQRDAFRVDARQYISQLNAMKGKTDARARAEMEGLIKDASAAGLSGKNPFDIVSPEKIRQVFPDEASSIIDNLFFDADTGASLQDMSTASPAERAAIIGAAQPEGQGFAREQGRQQALLKANAQIEQQLKTDPAAYVMSAFDIGLGDALQSGNPSEIEGAVNRSISAQRRMGVAAPRVLDKATASNIITRLENLPPENRADAMVTEINGLQASFGDHFLQVMNELAGAGLPVEAEALIMTQGSPGVQHRLGRAINQGRDVLRKAVGTDATQIDAAIAEGLSEFSTSIWANADAAHMMNTVRASAQLYAYQAVTEGVPADQAAEMAVNDLVDKRYNFQDGYRVPVSVDPNSVRQTLDRVQSSLSTENISAGEDEIPPLKNNGRWATLPDESGVVLMWPQEVGPIPVLDKNGNPITVHWDELDQYNSLDEMMKSPGASRY